MSVVSERPPAPPSFADVNRDVVRTLQPPGNLYFAWMCVVGLILTAGILAWTWQIWIGMGAAGKRVPQMWAMYITTFVFWIGIGHAGTLISAVLYLFRARWRTSIYRAAEAMTIFAVLTAGLFPLIHAGRMWFAYFLLPYPNQRELWPNFKSPLVWDVFAISTYLTISTVFFIVGLVPDIAALRDASTGWRRRVYAMLSLGWEGSDGQWRHYRRAYGLFAALATPLVLSVHSVVSWDFAMALVPGWHSTLFAPFFVDGAIFSGFAMVLILVLPMRHFFRLHAYVTDAEAAGVQLFIGAAGLAAHLPGVLASLTAKPVIGVPLDGGSLGGADALYAVVQMPPGVPVATVAIGSAGAKNAGHLAARILALSDAGVAERVEAFRDDQAGRAELRVDPRA